MFRYFNIARRLTSSSSSMELPQIPSNISSLRFLSSTSSSTLKEKQQNCSPENLMILEKRVKDLARSGYHDLAAAIARDAFFSRKYTPVSICNIILDSMCSAGRYNNFFSYFRFFFSGPRVVPNSESYHHLIRAYCDTGCIDDAVDVYNFNLGRASQVYLSKALVNSDRFEEAERLLYKNLPHSRTSGGLKSAVYCNLISGHLRHSREDDDHWGKAVGYVDQLWRRIPGYEGTGAAIFMDWYLSNGIKTHAMDHYRGMMNDPKTRPMIPETGNAFLKCLTKHGESLEASKLFDYMSTKSCRVNSDSFNIMVNHCFELGKFSEAKEIFKKIPYAMHDLPCFNNFIEKLCEKGLVSEARKLLSEEMPKKKVAPDFATYQFLIEAYLKPRKKASTAIELFKKMVFEAKLIPHKGFCERFFDKLIKKGKIEEVSDVIEKMGALGRDVIPEPICYKIVIKGLISAGKLDKVKVLLNQMASSFSAPKFLANRMLREKGGVTFKGLFTVRALQGGITRRRNPKAPAPHGF